MFSVFTLVFFGGLGQVLAKENNSVNVENKVSATANTGGNKIEGSGTIKTGNANAWVQAVNSTENDTVQKNQVEAKAEVQGEGAEASVEVDGEKKTCTASGEEGCQVEINNAADTGDADVQNAEKTEEKKIIQSTASAVVGFLKDLSDKIISWFS